MAKRIVQERKCSVGGCGNNARTRGMCNSHYMRLWRHGDPLFVPPKKVRLCSVHGCEKTHFGGGFCQSHYDQNRRNGDPLLRFRSRRGAKIKFLQDHAGHTGDDCLRFPFPLGRDGYGVVHMGDVAHRAANAMLRISEGPPPSDKHECAHSCGNGHKGCVNPRHLRWATSKENTQDMVRHGTLAKGERHGQSRLTREQVRETRRMKGRESGYEVAERFGLCFGTVYDIWSRRTWAWLE